MSVFTNLPQDMLQYEISRFLDPISRAEFNGVLKSDEHVYQKLPADYALKHHILAVKKTYEEITKELNHSLLLIYGGGTKTKRAVKCLNRLFKMFLNPMNLIIISYQNNLKEMLIATISDWLEDQELYDYIDEKEEIQENARLAIDAIKPISFVRHIKIGGFKSVYWAKRKPRNIY